MLVGKGDLAMKLGISYCTESCNKTGSSRVESRHQTVANVPRPCLRRTWDARFCTEIFLV